jgi:lactoylglutathione lyase
MTRLLAAYPISDEDPTALPVRALDPAVAFYERVLGFAVVRREGTAATLARDEVRLGLVARADHDPGRAGSLAIQVDDLEALHRKLARVGGRPGEFGVDEWNGRTHRTFFLREAENGYCYCYFCPV